MSSTAASAASPVAPVSDSLPPRAVAVTGLGAVSAFGWDVDSFWQGVRSGRSAVAPPQQFDVSGQRTSLASEVPVADDRLTQLDNWARWSLADRFAVVAARAAWRQSGLGSAAGEGIVGGFFGGSTAGMQEAESFFARLIGVEDGPPRINFLTSHQINGPGDAVARHLGLSGPVQTLSSACASGGLALGAAVDALRRGEIDVAVAGGADSLCKLTYAGFNSLRAVDAEQCSPFRQQRAGLNLGEGAGMLVLETVERALERGATPLALVCGAGASCDAHHMTAPHPQGDGAARAIQAALDDAAVDAEAIGFVNAHGTGTPLNDRAEWSALDRVFGDRARQLPVTSTKGVVGHFLGSSGAIEAVATALCLRHGEVHPTPGRGPIDPDLAIDLVLDAPRSVAAQYAISTSFAFGGSNAAVLLGHWPAESER